MFGERMSNLMNKNSFERELLENQSTIALGILYYLNIT